MFQFLVMSLFSSNIDNFVFFLFSFFFLYDIDCRYVDDGRPFWQFIVSSSTGCSDSEYFEELYRYYTTDKVGKTWLGRLWCIKYMPCHLRVRADSSFFFFFFSQAWHLCDPEAESFFKALRKSGVKSAVVSNFDTRLRPLLQALKCYHWFDAIAVSAEVLAYFFGLYFNIFLALILPFPFSAHLSSKHGFSFFHFPRRPWTKKILSNYLVHFVTAILYIEVAKNLMWVCKTIYQK